MPKVVIELQANTQDAVNKIQQFAKAQKDAFDAVKAGNPALQDAYVKVSKLTQGTAAAAQATTHFNQAAKGLAQGGIRELAGGIPVVGNALSSLAGTLKGFPGILLGVVGAGAAFISFLKSVAAEADKTNQSIARMSADIQSSFMNANRQIAGMRAAAGGRPEVQLVNQFDTLVSDTNLARKNALDAAQTEREGAITMSDRLLGLVNPQALLDKQTLAETAYQTKRKLIDQDANDTIRVAREKLVLDLAKIEADLDAQIAAGKETRVEAETTVQTAIQATIEKTAELGQATRDTTQDFIEMAQALAAVAEMQAQASARLPKIGTPEGGYGSLTHGGMSGEPTSEYWRALGDLDAAWSNEAFLIKLQNALQGFSPTAPAAYSDWSPSGGWAPGKGPGAGGQTINVTVNQSGTVIQQDRDWDTLVAELGQQLGGVVPRPILYAENALEGAVFTLLPDGAVAGRPVARLADRDIGLECEDAGTAGTRIWHVDRGVGASALTINAWLFAGRGYAGQEVAIEASHDNVDWTPYRKTVTPPSDEPVRVAINPPFTMSRYIRWIVVDPPAPVAFTEVFLSPAVTLEFPPTARHTEEPILPNVVIQPSVSGRAWGVQRGIRRWSARYLLTVAPETDRTALYGLLDALQDGVLPCWLVDVRGVLRWVRLTGQVTLGAAPGLPADHWTIPLQFVEELP